MFLVRVCDIAEGYKEEAGWCQVVDLDNYHMGRPYPMLIRNGRLGGKPSLTTFPILYQKQCFIGCTSMEELKVKLNMMGIGHASC